MAKMIVEGISVSTKNSGKLTYISLTDIAKIKNQKDPRFAVHTWMKSKETISFLGLWEILNNPGFNRVEFDTVKDREAGYNAFSISPKEWIERTNAVGIISSAGRYESGTFAHQDMLAVDSQIQHQLNLNYQNAHIVTHEHSQQTEVALLVVEDCKRCFTVLA